MSIDIRQKKDRRDMYRSGVSKKISRGWEENVSPPLSFIANARVLYGKSDLLKKKFWGQ